MKRQSNSVLIVMNLQPEQDTEHARHLDTLASDGIDIFLLARGNLRGAVIHGTHMLNAMRRNHQLGIMESLILGHGYLATALVGSQLKEHGRVILSIDCSGPVQGMNVEATARGEVRGYLKNSTILIEEELESFDTGPFIGVGILSLTRHLERQKQPFTGQVLVEYGSIARDLANYYVQSEQTPTAFNLSVQFDAAGRISGAGGLFVQAIPGAHDEEKERAQELVEELPSLGRLFADRHTGADVVHRQFAALEPEIVGTREASFFCACSKERFARFIAGMSDQELDDLEANGPFPVTTVCHNCNSTYEFTKAEVHELAARHRKP